MVRIDADARPTSDQVVRASDVGTTVIVLASVVAAAFQEQLNSAIVVVSVAFFAVGCVAFLWALLVAAERSRTDALGMGGVYLLLGTAPRSIQVRLLGALGVQIAVTVATAAARPFTNQAFAVLAPMFGLGVTGLWGARFGRFGPRAAPDDDD